MVIKVYKDKEAVGKAAALLINAQVLRKPQSVLGLATGSSVLTIYSKLEGDFSGIRTFNLDEYCGLDPAHKQSYRYFMNENLFKHINIDLNNTFFPELGSRAYDDAIEAAGGIDLQLLGVGRNGHIAFNEPRDVFENMTHEVELAQSTIEANSRFFASRDDVPRTAITVGIGTIMRARAIVLVAFGEDKAEELSDMAKGAITPQCPASVLQLHNDVTVITDEAAAKLL
jgi:glucosamine-6-phosphate deaminase